MTKTRLFPVDRPLLGIIVCTVLKNVKTTRTSKRKLSIKHIIIN